MTDKNENRANAMSGNKNAQKGSQELDKQLQIRCSGEDKGAWVLAARDDGVNLTEYVTKTLNKDIARREKKRVRK